jgi:hypothetical protein
VRGDRGNPVPYREHQQAVYHEGGV